MTSWLNDRKLEHMVVQHKMRKMGNKSKKNGQILELLERKIGYLLGPCPPRAEEKWCGRFPWDGWPIVAPYFPRINMRARNVSWKSSSCLLAISSAHAGGRARGVTKMTSSFTYLYNRKSGVLFLLLVLAVFSYPIRPILSTPEAFLSKTNRRSLTWFDPCLLDFKTKYCIPRCAHQ